MATNDDHNENNGGNGCACVINIGVLPEDCIANVLSLTSPLDACTLSLVASTFQSAAESDAVWERFLPPDYRDIIARSDAGDLTATLQSFASKKRLYLHICDHPILIDRGTKSFSLEKSSGKKCYMLAAGALSIVWGDTPRYWKWLSIHESRFSDVAELVRVCWLEIHGKIDTSMLSPNTIYAAYFVFKTTATAYGFEYQPAEASLGITGGESETRTIYLDPEAGQRQSFQIVPRWIGLFHHRVSRVLRQEATVRRESNGQYPKQRDDGWMEIEMGEYVNEGEQYGELKMSLMEVKGGNWKSGLIVQGMDIRPKWSK